jgi:hypothetical protein
VADHFYSELRHGEYAGRCLTALSWAAAVLPMNQGSRQAFCLGEVAAFVYDFLEAQQAQNVTCKSGDAE